MKRRPSGIALVASCRDSYLCLTASTRRSGQPGLSGGTSRERPTPPTEKKKSSPKFFFKNPKKKAIEKNPNRHRLSRSGARSHRRWVAIHLSRPGLDYQRRHGPNSRPQANAMQAHKVQENYKFRDYVSPKRSGSSREKGLSAFMKDLKDEFKAVECRNELGN